MSNDVSQPFQSRQEFGGKELNTHRESNSFARAPSLNKCMQ